MLRSEILSDTYEEYIEPLEEVIDQVIRKLTPTNISVVEGNFERTNEIDLSTKDSR